MYSVFFHQFRQVVITPNSFSLIPHLYPVQTIRVSRRTQSYLHHSVLLVTLQYPPDTLSYLPALAVGIDYYEVGTMLMISKLNTFRSVLFNSINYPLNAYV